PQLVLHPDDVERCVTQWTYALQHGTEYEIEVRNRRYDGAYRWFLTRAVPVRDEQGQITAWFGTTTDIHERKQMEQQLRESEGRFSKAFHAAPYLTSISTLAEGRYLDVNDAVLQTVGYTREELIGHTVAELQNYANPSDRARLLQALREQGRARDLEIQFNT